MWRSVLVPSISSLQCLLQLPRFTNWLPLLAGNSMGGSLCCSRWAGGTFACVWVMHNSGPSVFIFVLTHAEGFLGSRAGILCQRHHRRPLASGPAAHVLPAVKLCLPCAGTQQGMLGVLHCHAYMPRVVAVLAWENFAAWGMCSLFFCSHLPPGGLVLQMRCLPFATWNPGLHCLKLVYAPTPASRYQVALTYVTPPLRRLVCVPPRLHACMRPVAPGTALPMTLRPSVGMLQAGQHEPASHPQRLLPPVRGADRSLRGLEQFAWFTAAASRCAPQSPITLSTSPFTHPSAPQPFCVAARPLRPALLVSYLASYIVYLLHSSDVPPFR